MKSLLWVCLLFTSLSFTNFVAWGAPCIGTQITPNTNGCTDEKDLTTCRSKWQQKLGEPKIQCTVTFGNSGGMCVPQGGICGDNQIKK